MPLRYQFTPISHFDEKGDTLTFTCIARHAGPLVYRDSAGNQRVELVSDDFIKVLDSEGYPAMRQLGDAPVTREHPTRLIRHDAEAKKSFQVGQVKPKVKIFNDGRVQVEVETNDSATIDDIRSGRKSGVSLGYSCGVVKQDGEWSGPDGRSIRYDAMQVPPLHIDHLAVVSSPRAPGALITKFDSAEESDVAWSVLDLTPFSANVIQIPDWRMDIHPEYEERKQPEASPEDQLDSEDLYQALVGGKPFHVSRSLYAAMRSEGLIQSNR